MSKAKYESWQLIVRLLNKILSNLDPLGMSDGILTNFDSCELPTISFHDYLARIRKYIDCSESCFILAFIYIDRALQNNSFLTLSCLNVHRLALAATILAVKYLEDLYSRNIIYAKIGGVTLAELNVLESSMLEMLEYNLYVSPDQFFQYAEELQLQSLKTVSYTHLTLPTNREV
eukprot:TRINITY_DN1265_c0_g3_i3.p1 TRINITY_DN1265_c0_g3~~TRINITY_DN1265_c0_g3_i3.p1  ORF type:complete len:175 (-),score=50.32 TRINITY_DN1265_c0_g3_i3:18-542(-)